MTATVLAGLLLVTAVTAAGERAAGPFAESIFDGLAAERDECLKRVVQKFAHGAEARCGFPNVKTKHFLDAWERAFPGDLSSERVVPLGGWVPTLGGWVRRYYEVDGVPTLVAYGGKHPGLLVAHFRRGRCGSGEDAPRAGRDGVTRPERIAEGWVEPVYPTVARRRRINGTVLLQAVIGADGRTEELCVLDEWPRGYGFADSAVEALRPLRYEPARRNGQPVRARLPIVKTFLID